MKELMKITALGGQRILARLIDILVIIIFGIPMMIWVVDKVSTSNLRVENLKDEILVYGLIISIIFELVIPILTRGKTIGKALMGLRMVSNNGKYASIWKLFVRSLMYTAIPLLESLPVVGTFIDISMFIIYIISLVLIFTHYCHQAVHDMISSIYVVEDNKYKLFKKQLEEHIES